MGYVLGLVDMLFERVRERRNLRRLMAYLEATRR